MSAKRKTMCDDELVTVRAADPAPTYRIPPPPSGFVARPSERFTITGPYMGDMVPKPNHAIGYLDRILAEGLKDPKVRAANTILPVHAMGIIDDDPPFCDLCASGLRHTHLG